MKPERKSGKIDYSELHVVLRARETARLRLESAEHDIELVRRRLGDLEATLATAHADVERLERQIDTIISGEAAGPIVVRSLG